MFLARGFKLGYLKSFHFVRGILYENNLETSSKASGLHVGLSFLRGGLLEEGCRTPNSVLFELKKVDFWT